MEKIRNDGLSSMNEVWRSGYDTLSLKAGRVLISDVKARLMVCHHCDDAGSWQHRSHMLVEHLWKGLE
jgi:hypothetical protein